MVEAARRALAMGEAKLLQTEAAYQAALSDTALEAANSIRQAALDVERETVKTALLEVRAPKSGIVKDLGVHTVGQVVQQGAVMLSVVPEDDALFVEAKLNNDDIGYVKSGQAAKVKVAAFQFQKFGLLPAIVDHVGQDAAEVKSGADPAEAGTYKVHLRILKSAISDVSYIESRLRPGMLVTAELHCGQRTVMEYLLSPVSKTLLESGRER
jgi:hemolysin D